MKRNRERRCEAAIERHVARGGHYLYSFDVPPPKVYDGPIRFPDDDA
jgi:hypothetical protein